MTQIREIKSEALQATIRRLFPSQSGFSEDLQATNLITPIVDVTPTAEGSQLQPYLQQALDFSNSIFQAINTTVNISSTPGFYRLIGSVSNLGANDATGSIQIVDGATATTKIIYASSANASSTPASFDIVVFLNAVQSLQIKSDDASLFATASSRQIADLYGNLTNPLGFSFE